MHTERKHANPTVDPAKFINNTPTATDPLLVTAVVVLILLVVFLGALYTIWGSGPVIAEIPWFTPMFGTFVALTALSVAFLSIGRYQVLRDPISFWTGLTFAAFGIGLVFYVLIWPDLLPNGKSFIPSLSSTAGWISTLSITIPGPLLLAAALLRWPAGELMTGRRAKISMAAWIFVAALFYTLLILFEHSLPMLVRSDGTYTPLIQIWNGSIVMMHTAGIVFTARRFRSTGDRLIGYVIFFQIALIFTPLLIVAGKQRYDLWWFLSRVVLVIGCLAVLYGIFVEYVHLFWRVRDSEARYRQLTESLPQLIWTTDVNGCCNYVSPQWVAYTGLSEEHHIGNRWLEQIHADDRQRAKDHWAVAISTGESFDIEYRLRRHDGIFRWFKSLGLPIRNAQSQIVEWFGTCTDIDDQKRVEAELREFSRRLERSNRDLQDFAYVASHDLQEPLRKIEAFGDAILEDQEHLTDRQSQFLTRMRHAAARMRSMVNGLLLLSRLEIQAQPFHKVDLNQIAGEVLSDLEIQVHQSKAKVEVSNLPEIAADPQQMRQLFQNLVGNALKFRMAEREPHIRINARQTMPNRVEILFEDNGIGFDEQYIKYLFQPFKRLVGISEYEGSGMGLAICRKICERHNGEISAHSQPGKGSTFIITLPVRQGEDKNIVQEEMHG